MGLLSGLLASQLQCQSDVKAAYSRAVIEEYSMLRVSKSEQRKFSASRSGPSSEACLSFPGFKLFDRRVECVLWHPSADDAVLAGRFWACPLSGGASALKTMHPLQAPMAGT